ncbi:RloB family protein [Psychroserpens burtonensis]|uniref:RloB family protein n=1 Tax=Psychroserpens burtonensis TaxID=49278 RepID=UPI00041FF8A4|nr:RloB family protein [Psychroserpens burtonensis]
MARGRRKSRGKKINPTLFVFCEGETEESYINLLKSIYRIPSIHIHAKIRGNNISSDFIKGYKQDKPTHEKDMTFLMYDLDVPTMLNRLSSINDSILLVSNPCLEFWFLLHYKNQTANISSSNSCREMANRNRSYKKGLIDDRLKAKLVSKIDIATSRAKGLTAHNNPSSTVYKLIEVLESLKS